MDNEIIPLPLPKISLDIPRHMQTECHHLCLGLENKISNLEQYSAFQRPLLTGWKRYGSDRKFYQAPCGVFFHSLNEIDKFLFMTDSKLRIDCFDLSKDCNIETAISKVDVSLGVSIQIFDKICSVIILIFVGSGIAFRTFHTELKKFRLQSVVKHHRMINHYYSITLRTTDTIALTT